MPTITSYTTKCDLTIKADFQHNGRIVRRLPEAFQLALIHQWIRLHQRMGARPTWQRITI
jgi:hypothetical protein